MFDTTRVRTYVIVTAGYQLTKNNCALCLSVDPYLYHICVCSNSNNDEIAILSML